MTTRHRKSGWRSAAAGWLLPVLGGCATVPVAQDPWFGPDKAKHFAISAGASGVVTLACLNSGWEGGEAFVPAIGLTLALGAGKEAYDAKVRKTFWSWRDLTWGMLGGLAGYGAARLAD